MTTPATTSGMPPGTPSEPSALEIRLLGGFAASIHGAPLPKLRSRQGIRLLALLALRQGREVEREYLAGVLWPESPEADGLALLRRALTDLRAALGSEEGRLESPTRHSLRLNLTGNAFLDITAFDIAASSSEPAVLDQALELYRGPFLEGFHEDWAVTERERREQTLLSILETRAAQHTAAGQPALAVPLLRRALSVDPLREPTHRALMAALADSGDHAAVAAAYEQLCRRLRRDLDVEPDEASRELYRRLRQQAREAPTIVAAPTAPQATAAPAPARNAAPPVLLTRFFGRTREREQILEALADPEVRLVTVTGPGGAGKTRIAIETARTVEGRFPGGLAFVPLADVRDGNLVADAIARALGLTPVTGKDMATLVTEHLTAQTESGPYLLVLDNLEQLLGDLDTANPTVDLVAHLLMSIPLLTGLLTSRQPLRLGGEREVPLAPLSLPPGVEETPERLGDVESVALFVDRARAIRPDFALTALNAATIAEICRRMEGMPLALEMAAAWMRILSPPQILQRLSRQLDALVARRRDLPERHQSLRATLEWSYQLLSPIQQQFLASLAVFRGGWDLEAAEAVLGEDALERLIELTERSLVVMEPTAEDELPRYRLLEVVREFATEHWVELPDREQAAERYYTHYTAFVSQANQGLVSAASAYWVQQMDRDYENVRATMEARRDQADGGKAFVQICLNMARYWTRTSRFAEAHEWIAAALKHPSAQEPSSQRAQLWNKQATMYWRLSDFAGARQANAEALAFLQNVEDSEGLGESLTMKAHLLYYAGEFDVSLPVYEAALAAARKTGQSVAIASCLGNLGVWHVRKGKAETAREYLEEQASLRRQSGDRALLAVTLGNLGDVLNRMGDSDAARRTWAESMTISRQLGDRFNTSYSLNSLGNLALKQGDLISAVTHFQESLALRYDIGARWETAVSLEWVGEVALAAKDYRPAVRFYAAAAALRDIVGTAEFAPRPEELQESYEGCVAQWGESVAAITQVEGRTLPLATMVAEALAYEPSVATVPPRKVREG